MKLLIDHSQQSPASLRGQISLVDWPGCTPRCVWLHLAQVSFSQLRGSLDKDLGQNTALVFFAICTSETDQSIIVSLHSFERYLQRVKLRQTENTGKSNWCKGFAKHQSSCKVHACRNLSGENLLKSRI